MKKILGKIIAVALSAVTMFSLTACGNEGGGTTNGGGSKDAIKLLVWGAQDDQFMLGEMAEAYEAANPDKKYEFEFGVVGEPDVISKLSTDISTAADVFSFPSDQLRDMVNQGMLYEVGGVFADPVKTNNTQASVNAVTLNDKLYGFPSTADNTYFLFYDDRVLSETDVASIEGILAKVSATQRFFMDISNGWYLASFFLTAGGTMDVSAEGKQVLNNWDSQDAVAAAGVANTIANHAGFVTGDDEVLKTGFSDGSIVCGVTGIWNKDAVAKSLGEHLKFAKLPTITIGTEAKQMISFGGFKAVGVNKTTKNPGEAMKFAQFITNYENQLKRYDERGFAPTNIQAAANEKILSDIAIAALSLQMQYSYPQTNVISTFWTPAEALGTEMEKKTIGDVATLTEQIQLMIATITG